MPKTVEEYEKKIKELNAEAAKSRVENQEVKKALAGFDASDRDLLLKNLELTVQDPKAGALAFRDMSRVMLNDDDTFLDGIAPEPTETNAPGKKEENVSEGITEERLMAIFAERDKADNTRRTKSTEDAATEKLFKEVEDLGIERGSTAFRLVFMKADALSKAGEDVVFADLAEAAKQAAAVYDGTEYTAPGAEDKSKDKGGKEHAKSVDAGSTGVGDAKTQTIQEAAEEAGVSVLQLGMERAEARLRGDS